MSSNSSRLTLSEPRYRPSPNWNRERSDSESGVSKTQRRLNGSADRPNNWQEISDWSVATNSQDAFQPVNNAEQDNRLQRDRPTFNTGWFACQEGSPKRAAARVPRSYPRTGGVDNMQRTNIDNIRQRLTLGDVHDASTDGEKSSECNVQSAASNRPRNNSGSLASGLATEGAIGGNPDHITNLNVSKDGPDSNQIIGRLMQIRDYIKQATAMMQQMKKVPNSCTDSSYVKLNSLLESLCEQEKGYLNLLQKVLEAKEEDILIRQNSSDSRQVLGSDVSTELDEQSEASSETQTDLVAMNDELESLRQQHELLKEMLNQEEQMRALRGQQAVFVALKKEAEGSLNEHRSRNADIMTMETSRHGCPGENDTNTDETGSVSEDIPVGMVESEAQNEMANRRMAGVGQSAGSAHKLQRLENLCHAEDRQPESLNTGGQPSLQTEVKQPCEEAYEKQQLQAKLRTLLQKKQEMDQLMQELQTLRDFSALSNSDMSTQVCQPEPTDRTDEESELQTDDVTPQQLEEMLEVRRKQRKLEVVKERLDQLKQLVQYYKTSSEFIHSPEQEGSTAGQISHPDVAEGADASSEPPSGDYENAPFITNLRKANRTGTRKLPQLGMTAATEVERMVQEMKPNSEQAQNDGTSDESSDFGGWGNDPSIKEKVQRLKAAKEKLHHLKALVSVAHNNPEGLTYLPKELAQLAASFGNPQLNKEHGDLPESGQEEELNTTAAASSSNVSSMALNGGMTEKIYQRQMAKKRYELEQLMEEKRKLLALQENLQRLHDELPLAARADINTSPASGQEQSNIRQQEHAQVQTENESPSRNTEVKTMTETTQVTFGEPLETVISNEELYGQMRQQRILREELREKKKELEKFMKKDRPKRHYFRNQDNQSDNISYSNKSDQYGASASEDVTMATWGGSTAGNMESIEENDSGEGQVIDDCNDGYPNSGMIQAEEEEEANEQSEDRVTYTIEDNFTARQMPQSPVIGSQGGRQSGRRAGKGAPFMTPRGSGDYGYSHPPGNQTVLNNVRMPNMEHGQASSIGARKEYSMKEEISMIKEQVQHLSSQMLQLYEKILCDRERLNILERSKASYELWQHGSWPPEAGYVFPLSRNYMPSNQGMPLEPVMPPKPFYRASPFADSCAPGVPNSNFAYRNWANTRYHEQPRAERETSYDTCANTEGDPIQSAHIGSAQPPMQPNYYTIAAQNMPSSLAHSADNIPIETVHAANKQAVRDQAATTLRSSRSEETMATGRSYSKEKPFSHERLNGDIIIARCFSKPRTVATRSRLAEKQVSKTPLTEPRPQLNNDPDITTQAVSSTVESDGEVNQFKPFIPATDRLREDIDSDASTDLHAFEALRETIYSEIATLISQNESRPHFLIKLFKELQHLDSDYLRQRALYAIQDLVQKCLTEDSIQCDEPAACRTKNDLGPTAEDLTPSESIVSTEDGNKEESMERNSPRAESVNSDRFDYVENVDTSSSMSTPTSTDTHSDHPFAGDSLGDTIIHVEKRPGIDTHQLDIQIKAIMKEIMPVLKEHMEEICSQHLLQYIKRLVLLLMKQHDDQHEMTGFLHGQLGTLLQESLAKFEGRKLRDCREDLLVDMSEILLNELAFFRLMQGLENPKANVKTNLQQWHESSTPSTHNKTTMAKNDVDHDERKAAGLAEAEPDENGDNDQDDSSSEESNKQSGSPEEEDEEDNHQKNGTGMSNTDFSMLFNEKQNQERGEASYFSAMKIELAPSETKPYTRIGSDEDDEGEDEAANNEEPSDTAVSRDAQNGMMDDSSSECEERTSKQPPTDSGHAQQPDDSHSREAGTENEKDDNNTEKDVSGKDGAISAEATAPTATGDDGGDDEVTIDDLPTKLTGLSEEELARRMAAEQSANQITEAVVSVLPSNNNPLAGDPDAIKCPT